MQHLSISISIGRTIKLRTISRENENLDKKSVRYEEYTPLGKSVLKGIDNVDLSYLKFKVMDYNILSHTHMLTHLRNYKNCPRQCINWSYRKSVIEEEIIEENPDIICLQEVEEKNKNEFLETFRKLGFDALVVPRRMGKPDGCGFLYKTAMFRVAEFSPVHFFQPEVPLLDRPNVGMVVRLEARSHPGLYLVVANSHLLYNQRRVDIKLCQLVILLTETERVAYNPTGRPDQYYPVILTGDLNVNPDSYLIKLLEEGTLDENRFKEEERKLVNSVKSVRENLSISENCQYIDTIQARENGLHDPRHIKELHELLQQHRMGPAIKLDCEEEQVLQHNIECVNRPSQRCLPGILKHNFSFVNVYNNSQFKNVAEKKGIERQLTVYDYMFFSSRKKAHRNPSHVKLHVGQLHLLSRLRMPSTSEYHSKIKYLPNFACPSDHLPLVASFLLPLQKS